MNIRKVHLTRHVIVTAQSRSDYPSFGFLRVYVCGRLAFDLTKISGGFNIAFGPLSFRSGGFRRMTRGQPDKILTGASPSLRPHFTPRFFPVKRYG
jgi:hypothetical protein